MSEQCLRYVAIGDSLSEGVGDPWPDGSPRGFADRLAELLAAHRGEVAYANLAVRGYTARQVLQTQLEAALGMTPDLVTLTAGMNDLLRPRLDLAALESTLVEIVRPLTSARAALVIVPIPDVRRVSPAGRLLESRRVALNGLYARLVRDHGVRPLADTTGTIFEDPRAWADDRLHLSSLGHERLALAAATSFGVHGVADWATLPAGPEPRRSFAGDLTWLGGHVAPWLGRRLTGRSSGDGRVAKRPSLDPVELAR